MALQIAPPAPLTVSLDLDRIEHEWSAFLAQEYAQPTVFAYLKGLRLYRAWLTQEGLNLLSAKPYDLRRWRDALKASSSVSTVNLWLTGVRRFYAWLVEAGAPIANPAAPVRGASRRGQTARHRRDELAPSEVLRVLDACDESPQGRRDKAMVTLMAYCALRTIEVQRADLGDLQTKDGRLILWVRGKGRSEADDFVVLPAPAETALQDWLALRGGEAGPLFPSFSRRSRGARLSLRAIRGVIKGRYQLAGVVGERKTTHSLRHSAITAALRHGASPLQVQAMARHRSFDTTMTYAHELGRTTNPAEDFVTYRNGEAKREA